MDEDGADSALSTLIARIEAYAADPTTFAIPGPSTRHELWLEDESQRIDAATQLSEELMALQSIYTDDAIHVLKIAPLGAEPAATSSDDQLGKEDVADPNAWLPGCKITLSISTDVEAQDEAIPIRLAVTLPPFYPHSSRPPQLQLMSRYVGGFSVDPKLFGEILRAFYHQTEEAADAAEEDGEGAAWIGGSMDRGVKWTPGEVVLFEGIEWVKEKVTDWWGEKEAERLQSAPTSSLNDTTEQSDEKVTTFTPAPSIKQPAPFTGTLFQTTSIIERKSEFIGYAASITSPAQVASVLTRILSDKRVARATHPIINAWVCRSSDGIVHRDCDDDGETAAGGRLAHLLGILELENVIVVVTRWYGGVHLGADRFKLINRAAREALDLGGFVGKNAEDEAGKGKGMGKRHS
ncbi:Impact, N-terminal [Kalmanozyma brasiliensis GHG001]|uniref:RWD domain-containing protein n=1 Tax=Kalmanozyma brasiliensis (strain GHG001) TaxID=1365824 RepID=V5E3K2_KALBG|nr:Impact, N-terminal [Kalmanozyma brasiliensis GHG001]EST04756.1 Impact, N-terminal [Kalmanozyma brasiliensis GHG001]